MPRIKEIVQDWLDKQGVTRPPVPVERVAQNLGVELRYEPFEGKGGQVSGMLFRDGGRTVIGVNADEAPTRQRFTIAHELGHLALHKDAMYLDTPADVFFRSHLSSKAIDKKEIQANTFAAELLMPEKLVRQEFKREQAVLSGLYSVVSDEDLVERLSKIFQVSGQAMTFRLANLGLMDLG